MSESLPINWGDLVIRAPEGSFYVYALTDNRFYTRFSVVPLIDGSNRAYAEDASNIEDVIAMTRKGDLYALPTDIPISDLPVTCDKSLLIWSKSA